MTTLEKANELLIAAMAAALVEHSRDLLARGLDEETRMRSIAQYSCDLHRWQAAAIARVLQCFEAPSLSLH